ncbi:MAG TPA: hypothetical protein VK253_08120 [Candidatus Binatia bacterium]|nr:hypothetical protein [Candidatus Binatia bacterium]
MIEKTQKNKTLDGIAWGVFIVLLGAGWTVSAYYNVGTGTYVAFGVGVILIALNLSRRALGIAISKFSLFIGLLAFALAGTGIAGFEMPFIPTVIVLVGLFIVAEAIQKTFIKNQMQA